MTYRELIELYKAGELELEQQKKIEQDIERQEAIGDYLYEKEEIPELGDVFTEKDDTDFVKVVNRSIEVLSANLDSLCLQSHLYWCYLYNFACRQSFPDFIIILPKKPRPVKPPRHSSAGIWQLTQNCFFRVSAEFLPLWNKGYGVIILQFHRLPA